LEVRKRFRLRRTVQPDTGTGEPVGVHRGHIGIALLILLGLMVLTVVFSV
jgi:hypothetical protein